MKGSGVQRFGSRFAVSVVKRFRPRVPMAQGIGHRGYSMLRPRVLSLMVGI